MRGNNIAAALSIALAVWLLQVTATSAQTSQCQNMTPSPTLAMFVDPLPIPPSLNLSDTRITIGAYKITQKLHRDLPPTTLYAYGTNSSNAAYPAYTLEAQRFSTARIYWANFIPDAEHFLSVDRSIHWANPPNGGVPIVTHLHGAETSSFYDGHPDAWFTPRLDYGPSYTTQDYSYPNTQKPTMLWYHDHAVGITRLNVLAGLSGLYMIRSTDDPLTDMFPYGVYEIPIVLKDLQFWRNGSINFPNVGASPTIHPQWCPEYFGDTILVNGKVWPTFTVYPRAYRFRFLNGANARFFNISMSNPSLSFVRIGTDGGYHPLPTLVNSLLIAPAERYDVIVDFTGQVPGSEVYFNNSAPSPFPFGGQNPPGTNSVMQFKVAAWPPRTRNFGPSKSAVTRAVNQARLGSGPTPVPNYSTALHRYLTLKVYTDANGTNLITTTLGNRTWTDPVTETPQENATEVWEMINLADDAHPIHVHLINFQVLNQQPFNRDLFNNGSCGMAIPYGQPGTCFTGPPVAPAIYQTGFKDTAIVWPGNVTRYGMQFVSSAGGPFVFDPTVGPGYVWHCHILDHEDNDMMRPLQVIH